MIVVDANIVAYGYIQGPWTPAAEAVQKWDRNWHVPWVFASEFRNVLVNTARAGALTWERAVEIGGNVDAWIVPRRHEVATESVLRTAATSRCSAYDAEYVVLAQRLKCPFVTGDVALAKKFPGLARPLSEFGSPAVPQK